jgi:hypothetical protein
MVQSSDNVRAFVVSRNDPNLMRWALKVHTKQLGGWEVFSISFTYAGPLIDRPLFSIFSCGGGDN